MVISTSKRNTPLYIFKLRNQSNLIATLDVHCSYLQLPNLTAYSQDIEDKHNNWIYKLKLSQSDNLFLFCMEEKKKSHIWSEPQLKPTRKTKK